MPQLEVRFFPSQILWLAVTFGVLYIYVQSVVVPKIGGVVSNRQDFIKETLAEAKKLDERIKILQEECAKEVLATNSKVEEMHAKMLEEFSKTKHERIIAVEAEFEEMYTKFLEELKSELRGKHAKDFASATINAASCIMEKAIGVTPKHDLLTECYSELEVNHDR